MKNLKLIVVTGLLIVFLQSCGIVVEDPEFQKCLLKQWDENRDGRISKKEAESIGSIYCDNRNIKSLAGIEQFENLWFLDCNHNKLTSLDVSHNTKLYELDCGYNNLTSLDVSDALLTLDYSNNPLRLSDLSDNALRTLRIQAEVEEIERKYMARGSSSSGSNFSPNPGNKYSWLRGYWQCATPYGSMMLLIDGKGRISSRDEDGNIEAGSYTVDAENNQLRVQFDNDPKGLITTYKLQNQQIYFGNGLWYYKFAPY